ncbi:MAG: 50S ribosomal protein L2 [Patescibacteria group bacterium]|jgi:large subunit ribosomal protein L2
MSVRTLKPNTSAQRKMQYILYRDVLTQGAKPVKSLLKGRNRTDVRNNRGVKTMTGRGGGAKRSYRMVDLHQKRFEIPATVQSIQYDPNRTTFIAHITFIDGVHAYILAPEGLKVGDKVVSGINTKVKLGNRLQLKNIPAGTTIHNIELVPNKGGQIARSAGSSALLMSFDAGFALLKMPSGEIRRVPETGFASIGSLSNPDHMNIRISKAGRTRKMGLRPTTRGKAKNPVDHPHGGGEGNTSIGLKKPKTKTGRPALGFKTRNRKKPSSKFIVKPRAKKHKK